MLIGRDKEIKAIKHSMQSSTAELGIIYGRRRIGKSTLLKSLMCKNSPNSDYYFEGVKGLLKHKQIRHFSQQLADQTNTVPVAATDWNDALRALTPFIEKGRHLVIFDELPWMASQQTELIALLKYYWDNFWKHNSQLTLILCGSIASFMVKHVVHSEALHNRKTFELCLEPMSSRDIRGFFPTLTTKDILNYYIIFGGIPKYLEQINPHESLQKNLDRLCFHKNGFFINEFETIFKEQFKKSRTYEIIVETLSKRSYNKETLARTIKLSSGGGFSGYLQHLEIANFIRMFKSFDFELAEKAKTRKYVLWDEWLRFYFAFIKKNMARIKLNTGTGMFSKICEPYFPLYCGYGFERIVIKNIPILLDILAIPIEQLKNYGPFFRKSGLDKSQAGLQIDLLLEEDDKTIHIVECKYNTAPLGLEVAKQVEAKIQKMALPKRYFVDRVLIASGPVSQDLTKKRYFNKIIQIDEFFK